jgi:hypothetical protein
MHPYTYNEVLAQENLLSVEDTINSAAANTGSTQRQGSNPLSEVYI